MNEGESQSSSLVVASDSGLKISGRLILVLGPSGSGKGTVFGALKKHHPNYVFPLSCTTREMRPGEKEGEVYHFVSVEEFQKKEADGEFLETAIVHGKHHYGTLKEAILAPLREGKIVIREVDVQGLRAIREMIPREQLRSIFLTVDSWETLRERILRRSQLSEEELERRRQSFLVEMSWAEECDFVVESREGDIEGMIAQVEVAIESTLG